MTYQEQLLTPEWKELRDHILERDGHECQTCMNKENLQVHHKKYFFDVPAWYYPDNYLITLCNECHARLHEKDPTKKTKFNNNWDKIIERLGHSYAAVIQLRKREVENGK